MCGHDRGNGAPIPQGAIGASMHPLGVHKYAGGVQSCANRLLLKLVRAAVGPDRDRAWQFRHARSAPTPLVARLRSSPSGSRARHRLIAAHYCVAARSAPLHAPSPCSACASPRRTRTASASSLRSLLNAMPHSSLTPHQDKSLLCPPRCTYRLHSILSNHFRSPA